MVNGGFHGKVPGLRRAGVDEVAFERHPTQQAFSRQFREHVSLNGVATFWHPIEHIIVEDVGTCVNEVGEHFFGGWLFFESSDPVVLVKANDAEPGGVLHLPQPEGTDRAVGAVHAQQRRGVKRRDDVAVETGKGTAHDITAVTESPSRAQWFVLRDNSDVKRCICSLEVGLDLVHFVAASHHHLVDHV